MTDHPSHSNGSGRFHPGRLALRGTLVIVALACGGASSWAGPEIPVEGEGTESMLPPERPDDPPGVPA